MLNHSKTAILSTADDGTMYCYKIDYDSYNKMAITGDEPANFLYQPLTLGISEHTFSVNLNFLIFLQILSKFF